MKEGISEREKDRGREGESLSVNVWGVGTVNGAAETLSENLAQQ